MNLINLELATENAALAKDPNFHAVLTAAPDAAGAELSQTNNTDAPNQFIAIAPYTMFYWVRDISVRVGNTWVPVADSGTIAQDINVSAACEGWFTGSGTLTYTATADHASYIGSTNFPIRKPPISCKPFCRTSSTMCSLPKSKVIRQDRMNSTTARGAARWVPIRPSS